MKGATYTRAELWLIGGPHKTRRPGRQTANAINASEELCGRFVLNKRDMLISVLSALVIAAPRLYAAYDLTCVAGSDGRPACVGDPHLVDLVTKMKVGRPLDYGISPTDACAIDSTATLQCNSGRQENDVRAMRMSEQKIWWQNRDGRVCAGDIGSVNSGCTALPMKAQLTYAHNEHAYLSDGNLCSASALLEGDESACGKDGRFKGVRAMTNGCAIDGIGQAYCKTDVISEDAEWARSPLLDNAIGLVQAGTRICYWGERGGLHCFDAATDVKPTAVPTLDCVTQAVAGADHVCAETCGDAEVRCLFGNRFGVLGQPVAHDRAEVKGLSAKVIAAGIKHVCALAYDGQVYCWGDNTSFQLGQAPSVLPLSSRPVRVKIPTLTSISARDTATCGISSDKHLWCFGGGYGEPHMLESVSDVTLASIGNWQTCAVTTGKVHCWVAVEKPVAIAGLADVVALDVANQASCAVRKNGTVSCWSASSRGRATQIRGIKDAVSVTADDRGGCARRKRGEVVCWGVSRQARKVENGEGAIALRGVAGTRDHCMVRDDGRVGCWGTDPYPLVKDLEANEVRGVPGLGGVVDLSAGKSFLCAIARGGTVGCMADSGAILGAGDLQFADVPVRFSVGR
ncbi:MAG: hypothetical protein H7Z43_03025 [Clostridia bacterium]|nr:hypothetical protein [Deltaproteobacteria bacterium]